MKKIKFRGISTETGKYVYGDLVRRKGLRKKEIWQIVCNCAYSYVDPESVVPFVGYDADGKEVYEGDVLQNDSGGEFKASLKSIITSVKNSCYCRYLENLNHRKYYRLKEREENENLS